VAAHEVAVSEPKRTFRSVTTSPLAHSVYSLYAVQLASYILPLVSVPYLIRTLGVNEFGIYVFAIAVARFGLLVTDWGFNFTATRDIVAARADGRPISPIYSAVVAGRIAALAVYALALAVLTLATSRFGDHATLYWCALAGVAGSSLLPVWLYQAYERLPVVTGALLGARIITTALLFVLVKDSSDVNTAVLLWSAPFLIAAAVALPSTRKLLGVHFARPALRAVVGELRMGTSVFVTFLFASVYTSMNAILLGLLSTNREVAYFGAAETVIMAAVGLIAPLAQALFPYAATAGALSPAEALAHVRRVIPVLAGLGAVLCVGVLVLAPLAGPLFLGSEFDRSIAALQVMSPVPLLVAVATALATQLMLPLRLDRFYLAAVAIGACLSLVLTAALVPSYGAIGTAVSVIVTETAILAGLYGVLRGRGLDPLRRPPAPQAVGP
jgi:PST family polysaccharide transporter